MNSQIGRYTAASEFYGLTAMTYLIENHPAKTMAVAIALAASTLFFLF